MKDEHGPRLKQIKNQPTKAIDRTRIRIPSISEYKKRGYIRWGRDLKIMSRRVSQTWRFATSFWEGTRKSAKLTEAEDESMRGRPWASSGRVLSKSSEVERLIQEQRSNDAKNADVTLVPTQLASPFSFSYDRQLFCLSMILLRSQFNIQTNKTSALS